MQKDKTSPILHYLALSALIVFFVATMAFGALAEEQFSLTIDEPENRTYNATAIPVQVSANVTVESLSYQIDGNAGTSCANCTSLSQEANLSEGQHVVSVSAVLGNEIINRSVSFTIDVPEPPVVDNSFALFVNSPTSKAYNSTSVALAFATNRSVDSISYKFDDGQVVGACNNCSAYSTTTTLGNGTHVLVVTASLGNISHSKTVNFTVQNETPVVPGNTTDNSTNFSLYIRQPTDRAYYSDDVAVIAGADKSIDKINVYVGNGSAFSATCSNCSAINTVMHLPLGAYTLYVEGTEGNVSKTSSVAFRVANRDDKDDDRNESRNKTGPRFTNDFEKLPKAVAAGEVSDSELASIIRANTLNPGVINRLIKTGKLGNASLDAILDTQAPPSGVFRKLLAYFGINREKNEDYAKNIYKTYNLSDELKEKIVTREDIPRRDREKVKKELREGVENKTELKDNQRDKPKDKDEKNLTVDEKDDDDELRGKEKKVLNVGKQGKDAPGQLKKYANRTRDKD